MLYRLLAVVGIGLLLVGGVAHAIVVDGNINTGGTNTEWGTWNGYTGGGFTAKAGVDFSTAWTSAPSPPSWAAGATNNVQPQGNSGNEWFDIEGLYVDISREGTQTYLNWAIITSDAGLTPYGGGYNGGEWDGNLGSAAKRLDTTANSIAAKREGANKAAFAYHRNPVISLDLDGLQGRELGLVLDVGNQALLDGSGATGTVEQDWVTTKASLFRLSDEANWKTNDTFQPGTDYPTWYVDLDTKGTSSTNHSNGGVTWLGDTVENGRKFFGAETNGMVGTWTQANNFFWEGRMNITDMGVQLGGVGTAKLVSYGLFCGNDYTSASQTGELIHFDTPELSTWALLGCTGLMGLVGVGRRRRRSA